MGKVGELAGWGSEVGGRSGKRGIEQNRPMNNYYPAGQFKKNSWSEINKRRWGGEMVGGVVGLGNDVW